MVQKYNTDEPLKEDASAENGEGVKERTEGNFQKGDIKKDWDKKEETTQESLQQEAGRRKLKNIRKTKSSKISIPEQTS